MALAETLAADSRFIGNGTEIPAEGYCDQPYVVITDAGHWLCVMTTGPGHEGDERQHVVSSISTDQGKTWDPLTDIEPLGPPEASWVMPLKVPGGRVYAFYVYNGDGIREVPSPDGVTIRRVDTLGHYAFKYSDDHGQTWSAERYRIPLRVTDIDRENIFGGTHQFFWGVGKPIIHEGSAYFGAAKVGNFVRNGFMEPTEGIILKSTNILSESDPDQIEWELLPDGEIGLRAPIGPVADEHNPVGLSDGSLSCTYRTIDGYLCQAYSQDGGHTWTPPSHAVYEPGGRKIKHPRAASFVKRFSNGKFILWYHNHGGRYYMDRNPVWISGGTEIDGQIHWSEPEILLYDEADATRMSYPDFIEEDGRFWISETQKTVARVHEIDRTLLDELWTQREASEAATAGVVLDLAQAELVAGRSFVLPKLPRLDEGHGFTFDLWLTPGSPVPDGERLLDTRNRYGAGLTLELTSLGTLRLTMSDRYAEVLWETDPGDLVAGQRHHVSLVVDGGPRIIRWVVDGKVSDGGDYRPKGWTRFPRSLAHANGSEVRMDSVPTTASGAVGGALAVVGLTTTVIDRLRVYDRPLRVTEAIGNYRAGR